jgi:hypothetical protein
MTYAKPELVPLADARVAIQSNTDDGTSDGSKEVSPQENISHPLQPTNAAYEADE